ncbi:hypothetical protein [Tissierella sp.]|uniref:hypothetical protein n=1 Tax=Tissierella sp. TaxID=41274 RepID=UPI00285E2B52|nr:hypothetical protein [Tissierella sp.]MDR7856111.1 hypothetical protein [Tissierella sp.]
MISYGPLRELLGREKPNGLNMKRLIEHKIITPNISVTLNNDTGNVSLSTIDKIANYLSRELGRAIKIEEIVEIIPDETIETNSMR